MRNNKLSLIKKLSIILIVISISLYYIFNTVDIKSLINVISGINIALLIMGILVFYFSVFAQAYRWKLFLTDLDINMSFISTSKLYLNGQYLSLFLPFKLGDFYRGIITSQNTDRTISTIMGTIISERLIDLVLLSVGLVIFTPLVLSGNSNTTNILIWAVVVLIIVIISIGILYYTRERKYVIPYFKSIQSDIFNSLLSVSQTIKNNLLSIFSLTFIVWFSNVIRLWLVVEALNVELGIYAIFFVSILLALASGMPYIPSGIGVFEIIGSQALIQIGLTPSNAIAIVLVERFINTITFIVIGTIVYLYTRTYDESYIDIKELIEKSKNIRD
jgi:uncharacterized protein (TIRG00374 family)